MAGEYNISVILSCIDEASAIVQEFFASLEPLGAIAEETAVSFASLDEAIDATDASLGAMDAVLEETDAALASLDDVVSVTGVGFNGLTDSADAFVASLTGVDAAFAEAGAAADAATASIGATDAALASVSTSADAAAVSTSAAAEANGKVAASADASAASLGPAGIAVAAVGVALVATGAKAVQMGGDFQQAMIKSQAEAGLTQQQVTQMGNAILQMAPQVGQAPTQLANGLFFVESAGFAGKDALDTLRLSAQMASNDMTDTATVTKGLTTAVKAFGYSTSQSAFVANQMTATVANGKLTMADYATSIGKIALTAHGFGVSMGETNAGLDTLTNNGFPSAARASTALNALFLQFDGNTATVAKNIQALGIKGFDETKFKAMDFGQQVQYLNTTMKGHEDQLKKVLGGNQTAASAFQALAGNTGMYNSILGKLNAAQQSGGAETQAFAATQQGYNFKMQQAQAATGAMMVQLGQYLIPVLEKAGGAVADVVGKFANWVTTSGVVPALANAIGGALHGISTVVGGVVSGISSMIHWFQQGSAPAQVLKVVLEGVVAGLTAMKAVQIANSVMQFAATIPGLVAKLGVWVAEQWALVVPTLITMGVYILAGIAIVAVIALIILAVQHWGDIVKWLQGVWKAIATFFVGLWNDILSGLKAAWGAIVNAVKVGAAFLLAAFMGPIVAIAGAFVWLYNHNTYFKAMIDAIVNVVKAGLAWLQGAWQAVITWIGVQWNALVVLATALWKLVSGAIHDGFTAAIGFVESIWNTISSFFVNAWNTYIAGPLHTLWTNVSNVFSSAWNTYIAGPLGGIWNSVSKWFTQLGTGAANSGKNFINMLVSGITSGAGAIWNAVTGIASSIWKALGFHSPPPAGPAADSDTWMPNLINMLSSGLIAGMPKIQAAVNAVAQPLTAMSAQAVAGPIAAAGSSGAPNLTGAPNISNSNTNGGTTNIYLTINSQVKMTKDLIQEIDNGLAQLYRSSGLTVNTPSGRRY